MLYFGFWTILVHGNFNDSSHCVHVFLTHTRSGPPMLKLTCACIIWEIVERLFLLYHLPLTSAEQNDCAPEEISVVGESPVEERAANETNFCPPSIRHLVCYLLCLATAQKIDR